MTKFDVDLKIEPLGLKVTGTITSAGTVIPPPVDPPIDPPPPPDPPPASDVVLAITKPTPNQICVGSVDFDATVTVGGIAPTSGMLEYELRQPNGSILREGRQGNAPWTHTWDSEDYSDGAWAIRAAWITADTTSVSPWVPFVVSNSPVIDPFPPPVPPPGTGRVIDITTDADLTSILLDPTKTQPGDYIRLKGRFTGCRRVRCRGIAGKRIVIGADRLGDAVIDTGPVTDPNAAIYFDTGSNYTVCRNLIITSSKTHRNGEHAHGFNVLNGNHRVECCVTYGMWEGFFWSKSAIGDPANPAADLVDPPGTSLLFGYHCGGMVPGSTRGHGHVGYAQGDYRMLHGCVSVGGYGMGVRLYGSGDGAWARHSTLSGNVNVNTGVCYGGVQFGPTCITIGAAHLNQSPEDCKMVGMHQWISQHDQGGSWIGQAFENTVLNEAYIDDSYFVGGSFSIAIHNLQKSRLRNCDIVSDKPGSPLLLRGQSTIEGNRFWGTATHWRDGGGSKLVSSIPQQFPGNVVSTIRPPNRVFIYPDLYGAKKALVVIYNWEKKQWVPVMLPWSGQITVRNALDLCNASGDMTQPLSVTTGQSISITMTGQSIAQPAVAPNGPRLPCFDSSGKFLHPGQEFGAFLVEVE